MLRLRLPVSCAVLLLGCPGEDVDAGPETTVADTESGEEGSTDDGDDGDDDESGDDSVSGSTSGAGSSSSGGDADSGSSSSESGGTTGSPADTWENWALPSFFDVYCNHCHPAAGQSKRDFSDYETVGANFEHIRCGVAPEAIEGCDPAHIEPGHLPIGPGPYPSDEERWRLVDWLDAGMPRD